MRNYGIKLGALAALYAASLSAVAGTSITWDYAPATHSGNVYTATTDGSSTVTITGWHETGSGVTNAGVVEYWSSGLGYDYTGTAGPGGEGSPQHAVDNSGYDEFLLFSFNAPVTLTNYNLGWVGNDSDSTVLAWTGAGSMNAGSDLAGVSIQNMTAAAGGWSVISNDTSNGGVGDKSVSTTTYSSHWIIGAYMKNALGNSRTYTRDGKDYFKLASTTFMSRDIPPPPPGGSVPVPAPLALIAAGLFMLRKKL